MTSAAARRGMLVAVMAAAAGVLAGFAAADGGAAVGVAAVVSAGLATAALGFLAFRHVGATVASVSLTASHIATGHLGERVRDTSEATGDLTRNFNAMADRVQEIVADTSAERARLRSVFEASSDPMLAVDAATLVRLCNAAATALFGEPADRMLGRPLIESSRDYEIDGLVRSVVERRTPTSSFIAFGPRRTPLRASAVPIQGGGEWAVLLVLTDLSEVQRFEQVRRDFVSNVSHELRTPLASIKAMVETLEDDGAEDRETLHAFLGRIHRQVDRLAALVTDLLDLSRIESGAAHLEPSPIPLGRALLEAVDVIRPQAAARGVTIEHPESDLPLVVADHGALVRVIANLLDNAVKFSPGGSAVTVGVRTSDGFLDVSITDRGPGISPADQPRIFERFYKAEHSRSDPGTGLGLAIVKHLVQAQGGTISVESAPGAGSTFTARLRHAAGEREGRSPEHTS